MSGGPVQKVVAQRSVALWFLASICVAVAGPFGTYEALDLSGRLQCWAAILALAFLVGAGVSAVMARCCRRRGFWLRQVAAAAIFTLLFLPILRGVLLAVTGPAYRHLLMETWQMAGVVLMVPLGLGLAEYLWLRPRVEGGQAPAPAQPPAPRLLDRLAPERRGEILHLSGRDHYVDVKTDRGRDTLLMRFSDAMAELEGLDGLQVHRSHWVAADAVQGTERERGRVYLTLVDGSRVPVSRSYQPEVTERGLL